MTVLLREAIGDRLRHARTNQQRTLREVSRSARVSLGYLSEVERGRKEASSELLAAICDALELPLSELLHNVASDIGALTSVGDGLPERIPDRIPDTVPEHIPEPAPAERAEVDAARSLGDAFGDLRIQPVLTTRIEASVGAGAVFAA